MNKVTERMGFEVPIEEQILDKNEKLKRSIQQVKEGKTRKISPK